MIRLTRLTDYGIVLLTHIARDSHDRIHTVKDLARDTHLPLPTVGKVLKVLGKERLLTSHRGVKGGYTLARRPEQITVADIVHALDGPIAITDCTGSEPNKCELITLCQCRTNWERINQAVLGALENITLAEMARPIPAGMVSLTARRIRRERTGVLQACP